MTLTREQWLEERRKHIGASEVAAILGEDPHREALDIYERKINGKGDEEDNEWLEWGRDMEYPIAKKYSRKTGRVVVDLGATTVQIHPDIPWLGATLDRQIGTSESCPSPAVGHGALEIKNVESPTMRADEWNEGNPDIRHHMIQNQIQMACTGWNWGSIVGHFPYYQIPWFDQKRDDELLNLIYPILDEFWNHNIVKQIPPEPKSSKSFSTVKRLWPNDSGEVIKLTGTEMELANKLDLARAAKTKAEDEVKELEAKLRFIMKEATFGELPDGTYLSLKTTVNKGYTTTVKPFEYRTLRRFIKKGK